MLAALRAFREGGVSLQAASKMHNVSRRSLSRHLKVGAAIALKRGRVLALPPVVEDAIAEVFLQFSRRDLPLQFNQLGDIAVKMAREHGNTSFKASRKWVTSFLKRHPRLRRKSSVNTSSVRQRACSPETATEWIRQVQQVYLSVFGSEDLIDANRVWNMDETGMGPDTDGAAVLGETGRCAKTVNGGYREFFTCVATVSAGGKMATPLIIMGGKNVSSKWVPKPSVKYPEVRITATPTHMINTELFGKWLEKFAEEVKPTATSKVLLFVDNHKAHINSANVDLAKELNIELFGLPPNTTNATQPLDVGVFGPVKMEWRKVLIK
jgi:hypothetical protein